MSTTLTNGRQGKSLAEQIDRLDSVLDGLADGVNETVATAVKETVHAVLSEVLSNPDTAGSAAPGPAEPAARARWLARTWNRVRSSFRWMAARGLCWFALACPGVR